MKFDINNFVELSESELYASDAAGLGFAILGAIGGGLTGAIGGAVITLPCPPVGAVIGGIGGAITGGIYGWKK